MYREGKFIRVSIHNEGFSGLVIEKSLCEKAFALGVDYRDESDICPSRAINLNHPEIEIGVLIYKQGS